MSERTAEFVIHDITDSETRNLRLSDRPHGHEVARLVVSTNKWGPGNAIEKFVREQHPPEGFYLVTGDQGSYGSNIGPAVFNIYEVRYPSYTITGTRAGGIQLYGTREDTA